MLEALLGFIAGTVSGMGMGGGTILIPSLVLFAGIEQKTAQGINLLYFLPSAVSALVLHIRNKQVKTKSILFLVIGGLIGASIGSIIAVRIENDLLKKFFAIFLIVMGIYEFFCKGNEKDCQNINTST
ncbi:MAG: sulfite exporter TauE/SafE family protein [Clostridiaceae bacterium]|nr:sulfite exporter TauE/SafE family protein [Clostridiaceae bacterium]